MPDIELGALYSCNRLSRSHVAQYCVNIAFYRLIMYGAHHVPEQGLLLTC